MFLEHLIKLLELTRSSKLTLKVMWLIWPGPMKSDMQSKSDNFFGMSLVGNHKKE